MLTKANQIIRNMAVKFESKGLWRSTARVIKHLEPLKVSAEQTFRDSIPANLIEAVSR